MNKKILIRWLKEREAAILRQLKEGTYENLPHQQTTNGRWVEVRNLRIAIENNEIEGL